MKNFALGLSLLLSLGLSMVGCGDSGCSSGQVECDGVCIPAIGSTLAGTDGIQARVFDGSCAAFSGCHGTQGSLGGGLELSSAAISAADLINVDSTEVNGLRVAPGDTSASYLIDKLLGQNLAAGTARMPNTTQVLCNAKIQAVEAWVADGAN